MSKASIIILIVIILAIVGVGYFVMRNNDNGPVITPPNATSTPPVVQPTPTPTPTAQPGAPVVTTDANTAATNSTVVVTGRVNPNGAQTNYWYEYGKTPGFGSKTSAQSIGSGYVNIPSPGYLTGLTPSTLYYFRLSAQNSLGTVNGSMYSFTTHASNPPLPANAPTSKTIAASSISRTTANLNGQVDPNGSETSYWFEYGGTQSLGGISSFQSAGSGNSAFDVSVPLSSLQPATKYFFRLNAQNQFGTINGSILNFTTAGPAAPAKPATETKAATQTTSSTAMLNGKVNPNGAATAYWFEYGTDSLLGNLLFSTTAEKSLSSGTTNTDVSDKISGLTRNTRYYFRVVARNELGTAKGEIQNFKTNNN